METEWRLENLHQNGGCLASAHFLKFKVIKQTTSALFRVDHIIICCTVAVVIIPLAAVMISLSGWPLFTVQEFCYINCVTFFHVIQFGGWFTFSQLCQLIVFAVSPEFWGDIAHKAASVSLALLLINHYMSVFITLYRKLRGFFSYVVAEALSPIAVLQNH